jgi:5-methylcytosine-specific restriction endonuclease McrBC regulatory subunit McrC
MCDSIEIFKLYILIKLTIIWPEALILDAKRKWENNSKKPVRSFCIAVQYRLAAYTLQQYTGKSVYRDTPNSLGSNILFSCWFYTRMFEIIM